MSRKNDVLVKPSAKRSITRREFLQGTGVAVSGGMIVGDAAPAKPADVGRASGPDSLAEGFRIPPDSAMPRCYWWWLDSNATKEGITRDLGEMERQGIAGALVWDGGSGSMADMKDCSAKTREGNDFDPVRGISSPIGPLFMGPEWRDLFSHAVKEADWLGIEISFNMSNGATCGGPWVKPEHASRHLLWTKTIVEGPTTLSRWLPIPPTTDDYYRDVAVCAFPLPGFKALAMDQASATLTAGSTMNPEYMALQFPREFAAASLYIAPNRFCDRKGCELQISEDGKNYRTLCKFDLVASTPKTVNFDEVRSRFYRVVLESSGLSSFRRGVYNSTKGQQSPWIVPG